MAPYLYCVECRFFERLSAGLLRCGKYTTECRLAREEDCGADANGWEPGPEAPQVARDIWLEREGLIEVRGKYRPIPKPKSPNPGPRALVFPTSAARWAWIYEMHDRHGFHLNALAKMIGVSNCRAQQVYHRSTREIQKAMRRAKPVGPASRPIDMGGPRDVWLTFFPENQEAEHHDGDRIS